MCDLSFQNQPLFKRVAHGGLPSRESVASKPSQVTQAHSTFTHFTVPFSIVRIVRVLGISKIIHSKCTAHRLAGRKHSVNAASTPVVNTKVTVMASAGRVLTE